MDYSASDPGEYHISYSCEDSLLFDIQTSEGTKRMICNTPFNLGEKATEITLIPMLTKKNVFVDTNLRVSYKDFENNDETAYGTIYATIKNTDGSETTTGDITDDSSDAAVTSNFVEEDNSTDTSQPIQIGGNTVAPEYYGKPDLGLAQIARTGNESALSFTVYNYGRKSTGAWYFSYTDALNPSKIIISPIQPSLAPGQGLFIQVGFDGQRNSSQVINIYLDPNNIIHEANEGNNSSSVVIYGDRRGGGSYYWEYDSDDDADLVIDDLEVGRMSGSRFVEDDDIDEDDDAAVSFTVRNRGGESTGRWRFEIDNIPYDDDDNYRSGRQDSLRPGEETEIVVEFENPDEGNYNIRVEVDSDDDVDEEREGNNTESERLEVER